MSALSTIGIVHTAISLAALAAGVAGFSRHGRIDSHSWQGQLYLLATALTCLSGFFIFAHGGFGKAHVLGVITLAVLALALMAERGIVFGRTAGSVATVAYSLTFYFHLIPAVTETSTRLPAHAPLVASAESPVLAAIHGLLFVVFLLGARWQLRRPGPRGARGAVRSI